MVAHRKWWPVATGAAALAVVAGCSAITGGSTSGAGGGSGGGGGGSCGSSGSGFCITVDVTGTVPVHGTDQLIALESCTDYVKGKAGQLVLPGLLSEVGGHKLILVPEISKYRGPGTYQKDMIKAVDGTFHVDIDVKPYLPTSGTTAQAVIKADGSGSLTFTNLKEGNGGKGMINGNYRWTCSN